MNECTIQERTLIPLIRGERGPFGRACGHGESTGEAGGADECMIARLDPFIRKKKHGKLPPIRCLGPLLIVDPETVLCAINPMLCPCTDESCL